MAASTSNEVPELDSYSESEDSELSEDPVEVSVATSVSVPSLLDRLKCPTSSNLSRKRKIRTNPPKGKKRSKGGLQSPSLFLHLRE